MEECCQAKTGAAGKPKMSEIIELFRSWNRVPSMVLLWLRVYPGDMARVPLTPPELKTLAASVVLGQDSSKYWLFLRCLSENFLPESAGLQGFEVRDTS